MFSSKALALKILGSERIKAQIIAYSLAELTPEAMSAVNGIDAFMLLSMCLPLLFSSSVGTVVLKIIPIVSNSGSVY